MNSLSAQAEALYRLPLTELIFRAHEVHRANHNPTEIQRCTLLSIKTGGCQEDCSYCPQSAHYDTGLEREGLLAVEAVRVAAKRGGRSKTGPSSTEFSRWLKWSRLRSLKLA